MENEPEERPTVQELKVQAFDLTQQLQQLQRQASELQQRYNEIVGKITELQKTPKEGK